MRLNYLWSSEQANKTIPFDLNPPIFLAFRLYKTTQRPERSSFGILRTPEAI